MRVSFIALVSIQMGIIRSLPVDLSFSTKSRILTLLEQNMYRGHLLLLALFLAPGGPSSADTTRLGDEVAMPENPRIVSGRAPVNGIHMYYEIHGREEGTPLVLLHGGGSTIEVTFSRVLPVFASRRRVIAVEEQGHGRTSPL